MLFNPFRMAEYPTQNIVEVMGDAAGERTYRFHALGLLQARYQPCTFFFHGLPFGSINDGIESRAQEAEFARNGNATRTADRTETERRAGTFLVDVRYARPSPNAKRRERVFIFSWKHPADAWNMDNSIRGGAEPGREHKRSFRPARRKAHPCPAPDVQPRRRARQHKIGAVATDAVHHIGERPYDLRIDILRRRVDEAH